MEKKDDDNNDDEKSPTTTPKGEKEKKEEEEDLEDGNLKEKEEGDCCSICLDPLPEDDAEFTRWTCCGNGMHDYCCDDLDSMGMGESCPLCRADVPSTGEESVKQLRPWVKKGKAWAQEHMAQMHRDGDGVKQSYEMARRLYELAAQQGVVSAIFSLGIMYRDGEGVEQSYERAVEYYEQAADLGYPEAQKNLGVMYYNGSGVERDFQRTRELWTKSAAQGFEEAIANLKILNEVEGKTSMAKTSSDPNVIVCSNCNTLQIESHK
jgi:hypothetical protein